MRPSAVTCWPAIASRFGLERDDRPGDAAGDGDDGQPDEDRVPGDEPALGRSSPAHQVEEAEDDAQGARTRLLEHTIATWRADA